MLPQQVVTADVQATLHEVAAKMRSHQVGVIPILDNGRLAGVVTDRDIVVRALALAPDCRGLVARDVLSAHPVTIQDDADIEDAAVLMRHHRLHRLVVLRENGTVRGVVSLTDLSLLGPDAFEVLRRLSEGPVSDQFPEECLAMPALLAQ